MMALESPSLHTYRIDLKGIIRILAKHLYPESDVFVRELLQNAHDAIKRRLEHSNDQAAIGSIRIRMEPGKDQIQFVDNGLGMTEEEIHDYLATIGRSGTDEYRQRLIEAGRWAEVSVIGQFGIGLLSTFVVASKVEVDTQSYLPDQPAWRWVSDGNKEYTLQKLPARPDSGTTVLLRITEQYKEFLLPEKMRDVVRKYADFLPFPVYIDDSTAPVNAIVAPWRKTYAASSELQAEYFRFLDQRFPDHILHVMPVNISSPIRIYGALYISDRVSVDVGVSGLVDIYQNGLFVQSKNRELLPLWAKFVRGVVDSPDLTLTLARSDLQKDSNFLVAQNEIGKIIVESLGVLAKNEPARLQRILDWHEFGIKLMALKEDDFFRAIAELVPFDTNRGKMNLETYFQYSQSVNDGGKSPIYYFTEGASASICYLLCDERGIVGVNASSPSDRRFLEKYGIERDVELRQIGASEADTIFQPLTKEERLEYVKLEVEFKRILPMPKSQVYLAKFNPPSVPLVVMPSKDTIVYRELQSAKDSVTLPENVRSLLEKAFSDTTLQIPVALYININNQTIQSLNSLDFRSAEAQHSLAAIYNSGLLLADPKLLSTEQIETIAKQYNQIIDLLIRSAKDLSETRNELFRLETTRNRPVQAQLDSQLTEHVTCFVSFSFSGYDAVFEALREVLEQKPFFWQLVRADNEQLDKDISISIYKHIGRAHCYIAEVSEQSFNVGFELGYIQQFAERPSILLLREDTKEKRLPANIRGAIYVPYPSPNMRKDDLVRILRERLSSSRIPSLRKISGTKRFLSPFVLHGFGLAMDKSESLSQTYVTVEQFLSQDIRSISRNENIPEDMIRALQNNLRSLFDVASEGNS